MKPLFRDILTSLIMIWAGLAEDLRRLQVRWLTRRANRLNNRLDRWLGRVLAVDYNKIMDCYFVVLGTGRRAVPEEIARTINQGDLLEFHGYYYIIKRLQ